MVETTCAGDLPDHADARCTWLGTAGASGSASCSLWWNATPAYEDERVGLIGHFDVDGESAALELLNEACRQLAECGCSLAIGPMDGNTWRRYRLVTGHGSAGRLEKPFFLEPANPVEWPAYFQAAGFHPLARYFSSVVEGPTLEDARVRRISERMRKSGFHWASAEGESFDRVLERIYSMSVEVFAGNFLYTPQTWEAFAAQYARLVAYVKPEFVILCAKGEEDAAFLFAIPDLAQAQRGEPVDTLIIKTVGVRPRFLGRGLGSVLTQAAHRKAWSAGYRRVIHALMHEQNESNEIMASDAVRFREYSLFSRKLR